MNCCLQSAGHRACPPRGSRQRGALHKPNSSSCPPLLLLLGVLQPYGLILYSAPLPTKTAKPADALSIFGVSPWHTTLPTSRLLSSLAHLCSCVAASPATEV